MADITLTAHAQLRCAQRNISRRSIEYIVEHGTRIHRTGVTFYILRGRDIPSADRRMDTYAKLEGTVLLVSDDGCVLTVYRHQGAYRRVARKLKYRLPAFAHREAHLSPVA